MAEGQLMKVKDKYVDASLASLFQSSAGPVSNPSIISRRNAQLKRKATVAEDLSSGTTLLEEDDQLVPATGPTTAVGDETVAAPKLRAGKKRKRAEREDDLEARYLKKLAEEESREQAEEESQKEVELNGQHNTIEAATEDNASESAASSDDDDAPPQHESLSNAQESAEVEKASRTVFLGNVSTEAITAKSAKKTLLRHLSSFFPAVKRQDTPFKVESIRFRSTAFSVKVPKKTAFIRQELMDQTTKSTNAYAVYNSNAAAREAVKHLNGSIVLNRHLRVDQVAHPTKVDHKRCVFVGNLGFVDDDSQIREDANAGKTAAKQRHQDAGDVEEGLWRQFGKAGAVESVRVVRDPQTRVGKGFAYVQFTDENAVEAALLFNDNKYPPLLPRKLRVMRAKSIKRNAAPNSTRPNVVNGSGDRTLVGRANKLLGRAGASQVRKEEARQAKRQKRRASEKLNGADAYDGDAIVVGGQRIKALEGHRASMKDGKAGLKFAGQIKSKSSSGTGGRRPTHRGARRGEAWKRLKRDA